MMTKSSNVDKLIKDSALSNAALQNMSAVLAVVCDYHTFAELLDHSLYAVIYKVDEFSKEDLDRIALVHMEVKRCLHKLLIEKEVPDPVYYMDDIGSPEGLEEYLSSLRTLSDYHTMSGYTDGDSQDARVITYKMFKSMELLSRTMHAAYMEVFPIRYPSGK